VGVGNGGNVGNEVGDGTGVGYGVGITVGIGVGGDVGVGVGRKANVGVGVGTAGNVGDGPASVGPGVAPTLGVLVGRDVCWPPPGSGAIDDVTVSGVGLAEPDVAPLTLS
jgi:hypothetical protein